jgi:hypothetical protein
MHCGGEFLQIHALGSSFTIIYSHVLVGLAASMLNFQTSENKK